MLDIKFIRENSDKVKEACANKNINGGDTIVDQLLDLDIKKRSLMTTLENLRATQNKFTKNNIEEAKKNKLEIKTLEPDLQETENKFNELLMKLPNIPFDDVPVGKDDSENVVLRQIGSLPKFNFIPKEHFQIGEELDIIDIERASTVAGSRFYFLKNEAALLEMALVNFVFSKLAKKGFSPVIPPVMIQPKLASGMGYIENHPDEE